MQLTINGKDVTLDGPCSVAQLIEKYHLFEGVCAVEVNRQIVPKRMHDEHKLAPGDVVEIVTLVGGG